MALCLTLSVGCSQDAQTNTFDSSVLDKTTTSQQSVGNQPNDGINNRNLGVILHELTIENPNDEENEKENILLPSGWGAVPTQYEGQYTIVNEAGEIIGEWGFVGQSPDQPEGYLPNHIVNQEKMALETKFGKGFIYQLELDLPDLPFGRLNFGVHSIIRYHFRGALHPYLRCLQVM